jgi:hemerythrin-like metal-binding protein
MEQSERILPGGSGIGFGIPELDASELRLSALALELNQSIAEDADADAIQRVMNQILLEALSHFELEERVLSESAYPLPKGHAALHLQMRSELEHAMEKFRDVQARALWAEYGLLVAQLFVEHMRQEAIKYQAFARSGTLSNPQGS